ncbi:MAG: hypothetical protein P4L53_08040 [Candidatus Obscuribacterales bacterium]|nr:hypothetical protein [Candidatus Obscuribacterales bacterium]
MRAKKTFKARKEFIANIAIVLLLNTLPIANAEENIDGDDKALTPDTIPTDSEGVEKSSGAADQCQFWGNSYSLKFHLKSCPFALAMNPRHVQFLKNAKEALELGEKPCRYCLPPYTLEVSCKILARPIDHHQS